MLRKAKNILCNIHSVKIPEFHISTKANERTKIRETKSKTKVAEKEKCSNNNNKKNRNFEIGKI